MNIQELHTALYHSGRKLSLAESCTGGKIAATLTAIPGTSTFLLGSLVVYSNEWKEQFLDVPVSTLEEKGAVSAETVEAMLQGLFKHTACDLAAAVSGIAGPDGGSPEKPVGTIYIGVALRGQKAIVTHILAQGTRTTIIDQAVEITLKALVALL